MKTNIISQEELKKILEIKDLTKDPNHAIHIAMNRIISAVEKKFQLKAELQRGEPVVEKQHNFYDLGYDDTEVTLGGSYTKYITESTLLRTQMTSVIPELLRNYNKHKETDTLWCCPGMVYRRDVVDRTHVGQPHQMDIWYITKKRSLGREDLLQLVNAVVGEFSNILGGPPLEFRCNETSHHYTDGGIEVEIFYNGNWLEILECGLAGRRLLTNSGLGPEYHGLALGMGLDRMVMIVKQIADIRILRDSNEKIVAQMSNLNKYKSVSNQPLIKRDMSIAVNVGTTIEGFTEELMSYVEDPSIVEEIRCISTTPYAVLPQRARDALGMNELQENWLIRIVLRHVSRTLSAEDANNFYVKAYSAVHKGSCGYKLKEKANEKKETDDA